jgi:hypothetical protein
MEQTSRRYRRLEPVQVVLATVWVLGLGAAAMADWSTNLEGFVAAVWAFDGIVLFYLWGPAASILVTPTHVIVNNPYVRYEVPRVVIHGPPIEGFWFPHLPLRTGVRIRLVALSLNLPRGYPSQLGRHDQRSLAHMMAEVPMREDAGSPRRIVRYSNIILAVLAALVTVAVTASVFRQR